MYNGNEIFLKMFVSLLNRSMKAKLAHSKLKYAQNGSSKLIDKENEQVGGLNCVPEESDECGSHSEGEELSRLCYNIPSS